MKFSGKIYFKIILKITKNQGFTLSLEFNFFAIKICFKNTEMIVEHLPVETARSTKFLLGSGATVFIELTSENHCILPFVHRGLVIPCLVKVLIIPSMKNWEIKDVYKDMVGLQYDARQKDFVVGLY